VSAAGVQGPGPWRRLGLWLGPALAALLLALPGLPLDPLQRRAAAVTVLVAVWWLTEAVPLGAASLVPVALFPLLGVLPARAAAVTYMNDLIFLFLGAFLLALGLERWGVHRRLALRILSVVGTEPRRIVFGFMLAATVLSMWLNNTATTLMMLPIGLAVVETVAGPRQAGREDAFAVALLLGLAYAASVGGMLTPVGTAPNQIYLARMASDFPELPPIGFATWIVGWAPLGLVFLTLGWWLLTRGVRRSGESSEAGRVVAEQRRALGPLRPAELRMALVFGLTALLWVTREDLVFEGFTVPGWEPWVLWLWPAGATFVPDSVSNSTVALFMAVLCFLLPAGAPEPRGTRLLDWPTVARLPWEVLLLLGGGFCLAEGFRASGLDRAIGELLGPAFQSTHPLLLVLLVAGATTALSEVASNTATAQVLLPVLGSAALAAGLDPRDALLPATLAASCGFMLPVATPPNAVVFASGHISVGRMARTGLAINLLMIVAVTLVYHFWVRTLLAR
jgi:sodium-dependent dicarboxylate transporter 2/3/5